MDLQLRGGEHGLLLRILRQYLSDLRMEIADTDQYEFRQALKEDEDVIKGLIDRLEAGDQRAALPPTG